MIRRARSDQWRQKQEAEMGGGQKIGTLIADYDSAFFGALKFAVPASPLALRNRSMRKAKAPAKRDTSARKKSRARKKSKK
jgi:hypothetical protein